jgi:hypothetical protein
MTARWKRRKTAISVFVASVAVVLILLSSTRVLVGAPTTSSSEVQTLTTLGESCTDPALPAEVVQVENDSRFLQLSGGQCYSYLGEKDSSSGSGGVTSTMTFDLYNGSVFYPCGDYPVQLVVSQIVTGVLSEGGRATVTSANLNNDSALLNPAVGCGASAPAIAVVSARLVIVTIPAVLEVNLTLEARSTPLPVTSLFAVLELPGSNQTILFTGVTASSPLILGRAATQTGIINGPPGFSSGAIYDMLIEGQYQGGDSFGFPVRVALVTA